MKKILTHGELRKARINLQEREKYRQRLNNVELRLKETNNLRKAEKLRQSRDEIKEILKQIDNELNEQKALIKEWLQERTEKQDMKPYVIEAIRAFYLNGMQNREEVKRVEEYFDKKYGSFKKPKLKNFF